MTGITEPNVETGNIPKILILLHIIHMSSSGFLSIMGALDPLLLTWINLKPSIDK